MKKIINGMRIAVIGTDFMLMSGVSHAETDDQTETESQLDVQRFMDALMDPCIDVNRFIDVLVDSEGKEALAEVNFILKKCEVES